MHSPFCLLVQIRTFVILNLAEITEFKYERKNYSFKLIAQVVVNYATVQMPQWVAGNKWMRSKYLYGMYLTTTIRKGDLGTP